MGSLVGYMKSYGCTLATKSLRNDVVQVLISFFRRLFRNIDIVDSGVMADRYIFIMIGFSGPGLQQSVC